MIARDLCSKLAGLGLIVLGSCALSLAGNLVQNGALEGPAGNNGMPPSWIVVGDKSAVTYDESAKCVCIANAPAEASLRQRDLELLPGKQYRLSCQVKTEGLDVKSAGVTVVNEGWTWCCGYLRPAEGTADWTKLEKVFTPSPSSNGKYQVVVFSPKPASGKIFAKDIKLEPVEEGSAASPAAEAPKGEQPKK